VLLFFFISKIFVRQNTASGSTAMKQQKAIIEVWFAGDNYKPLQG